MEGTRGSACVCALKQSAGESHTHGRRSSVATHRRRYDATGAPLQHRWGVFGSRWAPLGNHGPLSRGAADPRRRPGGLQAGGLGPAAARPAALVRSRLSPGAPHHRSGETQPSPRRARRPKLRSPAPGGRTRPPARMARAPAHRQTEWCSWRWTSGCRAPMGPGAPTAMLGRRLLGRRATSCDIPVGRALSQLWATLPDHVPERARERESPCPDANPRAEP